MPSAEVDFTSALYLGMEHPSRGLPGWDQLTLGKPAALESTPGGAQTEEGLARLIGCERASMASSTLHLFWDLFTVLARRDVNIFLDEDSYPILRWGVERAACSGTTVRGFRKHDPNALWSEIKSAEPKPAIVVADGFCPGCGRAAPLAEYLECAERRDGVVVIDDTQALGIYGQAFAGRPYGTGGGGSMRYASLNSGRIIVGASLAKAFGAPAAVLAGTTSTISNFERWSATRVHCSPTSLAAIAAVDSALRINAECGDELRLRLARLVARLRHGLRQLGLIAVPGLFPVQPLRLPEFVDAATLHHALQSRGVMTVLHSPGKGKEGRISFVVNIRHAFNQIDRALACLTELMTAANSRWKKE
jgi:8-amino-7-oxononanoate synthase